VTRSFTVVHDVDGPKVRLGVAWFAVATGSCIASRPLFALVMAVAAACAADQLVRLHVAPGDARDLARDPGRLAAVLAAAGMPLAAAAGSDTLAAALAASVVVTMVATLGIASDPPAALPAMSLLGAVPMGLAASAPVLLHRLGTAPALFLVVLVCAYDAGDFIVGTGAGTTWEGPAAGVTAAAVVGFATTVVAPPPLLEEGAAALAVLVALLAPLGPPLASVLIGDGATKARFVRRLDSLLLCGPVAAFVLAALLPQLADR
jgi:hypothetical protein